jgi:drug/metabolite transporter (DMT)-like permease
MTQMIWALFGVTVGLDVWGQTAFKLGLRRIEAGDPDVNFWLGVARNPFIIAGVLGYAVEAVCWMYVIGHTPLSVVGPMAALAYVGAVVAGKFFLGEQTSRRRWLGAGLVTIGAAFLGASLG